MQGTVYREGLITEKIKNKNKKKSAEEIITSSTKVIRYLECTGNKMK